MKMKKSKLTQTEQMSQLELSLLMNNMLVFLFLGIVLNLLVMVHNDNQMPVYFPDGQRYDVDGYLFFSDFEQVKYGYLGDVFNLGTSSFYLYLSIGDLFIFGGIIIIPFILAIKLKRRFKK